MRRLRKFLRLPRAEMLLLLRAVVLMWAIRLALWILPFRFVRGWASRAARPRASSSDSLSPDQIARAVDTAGRYLPGDGHCLVHAMAAQVMLGRRNLPCKLQIGVARGREGKLEAHAWVESGGRTLIGGVGAERFKPIMATEGDPS